MRSLKVLFLSTLVTVSSNATVLNLGFERNGDKRGVNSQVTSLSYSSGKLNVYALETIDGIVIKVGCSIPSKLLADNGMELTGFMRLASEKQSRTRIRCYGKQDRIYSDYIDKSGIMITAENLEIDIKE